MSTIFFTLGLDGSIFFLNVQVKAYTTRVDSGPFPTEILGPRGHLLISNGQEFGMTTGRLRRYGWLDIFALRYSCQINGFSALNLTKLDVLSSLDEIQLGVSYKHEDGTPVKSFPSDLRLLEQLKVNIVTLTFHLIRPHLCSSLGYIT
jgi:adenylosuccinate synthase